MASASVCMGNCSSLGFPHEWIAGEFWQPLEEAMGYFEYHPWFFSLLGSAMVGLSGVFPLLIIPIDQGADLKNGAAAGTLKMLLSFAVGGLLGDVFLHLLPEAWANNSLKEEQSGHPSMTCGLWVLSGFLVFIIAEKMFSGAGEEVDEESKDAVRQSFGKPEELFNNNSQKPMGNNCLKPSMDCSNVVNDKDGYLKSIDEGFFESEPEIRKNGIIKGSNGLNGFATNGYVRNGFTKPMESSETCAIEPVKEKPKHVIGYLNLVANCVDNFTHGLAVGGSFLISFRLGALTTFAILIHEIPHEIGDFAILLKSGFSRLDAAKAQLLTATGGICGALVAVLFSGDGVESKTSWILPFTAGGFLHIGLVTVLPELLKETDPKESVKQLGALLLGITIMGVLTVFCE